MVQDTLPSIDGYFSTSKPQNRLFDEHPFNEPLKFCKTFSYSVRIDGEDSSSLLSSHLLYVYHTIH